MLSVAPSITLFEEDQLTCNFGDNIQTAILGDDGSISCPHPKRISAAEIGQGM